MSYVQSGKLAALAIGVPSRLKLPDVPIVAESGYPGYEATGWGAIFVPNGTPQPIIDKLNAPSRRSRRRQKQRSYSKSKALKLRAARRRKWRSCCEWSLRGSATWRKDSG
jgi:tripartite-type tricarboxylate transporter receptor subunit TctC